MSYSSSFVSRIAPLAVLAVVLAAGTAPIAAQTALKSATAVGQLTIGDDAPVPIYAVSSSVQSAGGLGGGGGAGGATLSDISVVKQADALSTALFRAIVRGQHLPGVRIDVYHSGKMTIAASFELSDVLVTGMITTGDQGEAVAFDFSQVTFTAAGQSFCWNTNSNSSC